MNLNQHLSQGKLVYLSNNHDQISVYENDYYRWLSFADTVQSIMHRRRPTKLTLPHQYAVLWPLVFFKPEQVVELGLGGANLTRFLLALNPNITVTSIELNRQVIEYCQQYFNPLAQKLTIKHDSALNWLQNLPADELPIDWLLCDVYQHHSQKFEQRVALITAMVDKLTTESCLTINLPDLEDHEINLCLTILKQLQSSHQIVYFHIPRYLNIVVHLLPKHWPINHIKKNSKHSYLTKSTYKRWCKFASYFHCA